MIRKYSAAAAFALAAVALTAGPPGDARAGLNLVKNGGFEKYTPGGGSLPNGDLQYSPVDGWSSPAVSASGYRTLNMLYTPGSADTTGSVNGENGEILKMHGPGTGSMNGLPATSPDGGNFLALDADPDYNGKVSQTVTGLTVGQKYDIGFYWARAQEYRFSGETYARLDIGFGAETRSTADRTIPTGGFGAWEYQTFRFTAGSTAQDLSFLAVGGPGGLPPFVLLDGVSVTAVPEPSAILLGSLGLFGVGAVRRWQNRRPGVAAAA